MTDAKRALALLENLRLSAEALQQMPEMIPLAQEIMRPVFNGAHVEPRQPRQLTDAERKRRSIAMKKRWRLAKKTGKSALG
jgi:hypothetical protein